MMSPTWFTEQLRSVEMPTVVSGPAEVMVAVAAATGWAMPTAMTAAMNTPEHEQPIRVTRDSGHDASL